MKKIKVSKIVPNKNQPRERFDDDKLIELAESIEKNGLIQPIIVKKQEDKENYELIAGERRLEAVKLIGNEDIDAIIKDVDEKNSAKFALIENIQREDLNPIEEAFAYKNMIEDFFMTQKELSEVIGKSRSYISNTMRLLELHDDIIESIIEGKLSAGHGKALLSLDKKEDQLIIAKKIMDNQISVRNTEELVRKYKVDDINTNKKETKEDYTKKDSYLKSLEEELMISLGTKVKLIPGKNKGVIEIEYYTEEDLGRLIEKLK